ncbi:MAG: lipoate--protein ligase, partial [Firmicutes bacterium]|nr:lipoate--protein ligase [Bacillota bacterium]
MINKLSYYIRKGFDPYTGLAIERFLTESAGPDECILYLWQNQNTVVIGYNQNVWKECRTAELAEAGGIAVRRMSGGGAVFHDLGNLNFTFCLTEENYDQPKQQRVLLEACRLLGIDAELSGRNDLTANGCKFSGNSFY